MGSRRRPRAPTPGLLTTMGFRWRERTVASSVAEASDGFKRLGFDSQISTTGRNDDELRRRGGWRRAPVMGSRRWWVLAATIEPSVRKQHNAGYKHKANVRSYYQQFEEQQTQSLIDQRIKEHLGQAAVFQQQIGASFNQHLMTLQSNPQGPRLPVLAPPILPFGVLPQGPIGPPLLPGVTPPVLPRPAAGAPGYWASTIPPSMVPPSLPTLQMGVDLPQ